MSEKFRAYPFPNTKHSYSPLVNGHFLRNLILFTILYKFLGLDLQQIRFTEHQYRCRIYRSYYSTFCRSQKLKSLVFFRLYVIPY